MITRKSDVAQHLAATPDKRRSTRIVNKANTGPASFAKRKSLRTQRAPTYNTKGDSSSSSSSDEDEDDVVKEQDLESSDDEKMHVDDDFSDEIGEEFRNFDEERSKVGSSGEKENRRRTRSQSRRVNEETPSKKAARDLKAMCSVSTPKRNLSTVKTPTKGKENTTPRKSVRIIARSVVKVFESSDDDYSDELGDEEVTAQIREAQKQKSRTPLGKITIKVPRRLLNPSPKVTPLIISKTPGGTLRTRRLIRHRDEEEDEGLSTLPESAENETLKGLASRLHLSKVPETLPCREKETGEIRKFIREVIDPKRGESAAMYISGVPGTGKTATVRAVVNAMQKEKKCPRFVYVEVNAMIFKKTVFVEIYEGIEKEYGISRRNRKTTKIAATTARQELNTMFKREDPNRPPIVVLIDELDSLCNRKQDVLYDIFEWTALPQSKVTIIGIANTLDFPERMLCQRNASRLDKRRLVFQPYEHKQIQEIVEARLKGSKLIEPNAVELVAKKIATNTGDLRQALDFLCRAIQVAVEQKSDKLKINHVIAAQNAVLEPLKYRLVKGLRLHSFILFRAVVAMTEQQEEVLFTSVYKTYCTLCTEISGIEPASDAFAFNMLLQLSTSALVFLPKGGHGVVNRRIKMSMSSMEAEKAIKLYTEKHKLTYSI